jgi:lysophospholipase L1-like esterase
MRFYLPLAALVTMTLPALFSTSAAAAQPLAKGERIVFLGDSITQAGAGPEGYVTLVRQSLAKSHGDLGIEVIGAGISGNKVPDLEKRLEKDVLSKKPTLVVIYIGINDVWHSESGRGTSKADYEAGLRRIIQQIKEAGARVILCTASVIGEKTDGSNSLDKMLDEYCEISRQVAADTKTQLLDLRKAFLSYLKGHNEKNAEKGVLTSDRVHLNKAGNEFVAKQMLGAIGAEGQPAKSEQAHNENKVLRHVVLFKFKDDVKPETVKEIEKRFAELAKKITTIAAFEFGTNNSPENLSQGFTHCFLVTFKSEKDRDDYLPHAAHKEFVDFLLPKLDKACVVDYWAQK